MHASSSKMFANRHQAGRRLAAKLIELCSESPRGKIVAAPILDRLAPPVVLALPRGGVPVGFEVAAALGAPLDVLMARKIGAPGNPELGMGAVAEGSVRVLSEDVLSSLLVSQEELEHSVFAAETEMRRRVRLYRGDRPPIPLSGRTAIIVDDGLATGATAKAAIWAAKSRGAARVVLAMPVGAPSTVEAMKAEADDVICLLEPEPMWAIGMWYRDFSQVPDDEVLALLGQAREHAEASSQGAGRRQATTEQAIDAEISGTLGTPGLSSVSNGGRPSSLPNGDGSGSLPNGGGSGDLPGGEQAPPNRAISVEVCIPYGHGLTVSGDLTVPQRCSCLVLFAHGSGSGRSSPRNRQVAAALNNERIATLLFDLLTHEEERLRANVFDISLLSSRLRLATEWARAQPQLASLPIGYFGASTGAAAALQAAAELDGQIGAVVCRGGRPDLAAAHLREVTAPVLLIVGGADVVVLDLNRQALRLLNDSAKLEVVPGAAHLFEEPGALQEVARLAGGWLSSHLSSTAAAPGQSS